MLAKNMGGCDRGIRVVIAFVLIWLGMNSLTGVTQTIAYVVAGILFITSLVGYCPLYPLFGCNTCDGSCKSGACNGKCKCKDGKGECKDGKCK